ncbi:nucleoplasmin-like protein [Anopheles bellator]|uniref:nucleoplasmin-like protein n=1 Tax=Anopheles bellator TaxID=139047 RepID=UPI002649D94A|nr:nucleoplasmin-like protein [Anopheles bellator]XP_058064580.1 nucleoplasmin-like protein [Anopheles bellator]
MADEYFYGATLKEGNKTVAWDPENKSDEYPRTHKLVIKQCILGHEAAADEYNVVQVETMTIRDTLRIPIAVLKVGETRQCRMDLEFSDAPVTFTLIEGKGPVHIHGQHLLGSLVEEFEDMEEMEEEVLDEEEADEDEDEDGASAKKKPKLTNNSKGKPGGAPGGPAGSKNENSRKRK